MGMMSFYVSEAPDTARWLAQPDEDDDHAKDAEEEGYGLR